MMTPNASASPSRALVVEDQITLRDLLIQMLEMEGWEAEGCSTAGAARLLLARQRFDLLLLDLVLPDTHGLDVLSVLKAEADPQRCPRVVVLTAHARPALIREAASRGAHGVVTKGAPLSELRAAIEHVAAGGVFYSTESSTLLRAAVARPERDEQLTERQREILRCVALGRSTREIAEQLGLSEKTVSNHRARIMERLGVHEVAGLTRHAITLGLIEPMP